MENIKIHIGSTADTGGFDKVTAAEKRATAAANEFVDAVKAGVGIDIGGKIVNSIAAIPGIFQQLISRGVEFNMTMDNAEVGISNVLARFLELDQVAAKREAAKVMEQLIALEPRVAGGLEDLVNGFMATAATALGAGLTVEQNIDLVGKFANALANAGKPIEQIGQEMRSILSGNITADSDIAKILGITNDAVKAAKEAGTLYDYLAGSIGKFGEAGDSAAVRMSSFESAVSKALGEITKPISNSFLEGIKDLTESLNAGDSKELEKIGYQLAEIVKQGLNFTKWLTENNGLILLMAKSVGGLVAAYAAFKLAAIIQGLTSKARALLANKTALDAETASLAANTAAQARNAGARAAGTPAASARRVSNIAGAVGTGVGIGLIGYDYLMGKAAEINARTDASKAIVDQIGNVGQQYNAAIKSAASVAEKQEIIKGLEGDIAKLREMQAGASEEDEQQLRIGISILEKKLETARKLSDEMLKQKELSAAAAEAEKESAIAKAANAEADQKAIAAATARRIESERGKDAASGLELIKGLMDKGDIGSAQKSMESQEAFYRDWLDRVTAGQAGKTGEELKSNLDMQAELRGYLEQIAAARKELPDVIAKADEEAKKKQIDSLQEQIALIEAQGRLRVEQAGEDAALRKQIEDEIAQKRLALENQIGALQEESATKREAREVEYAANALARTNQLADALKSKDAAKAAGPGDLIGGTNRRRGAVTSDSFEQASGVGAGEFARPLTNFGQALAPQGAAGYGLVPPSSVPPPAATPGAAGGGGTPQANPAEGSGSGAAGDVAKAAEPLEKALKEMADALRETLNRAVAAGQAGVAAAKAAKAKLDQIEQELEALKADL